MLCTNDIRWGVHAGQNWHEIYFENDVKTEVFGRVGMPPK